MPRSSISKTPLRLANSIGLIDGGYRGVGLWRCAIILKPILIPLKKGQRLFQIVSCDCSPITYDLIDQLSETSRGSGGFGSTGK